MAILMGPVLRLQTGNEPSWTISVLIVTDGSEPALKYRCNGSSSKSEQPELMAQYDSRRVLRYRLDLRLTDVEHTVQYEIAGQARTWSFQIPSTAAGSLRLAFATCNGFSSHKDMREVPKPYERWDNLVATHAADGYEGPFHLLLMGGDQVYADPLWDHASEVRDWAELDEDRKWRRSFNQNMASQVDRFYLDLYLRNWAHRSNAMREAFATIPTAMMWDDHDIIDGWGSYEETHQNSAVYQGIYSTARRFFKLFQLHCMPDEPLPAGLCNTGENLSYAMTLGDVGILLIDLRSDRTRHQVVSRDSWESIYGWLESQNGLKHLLIVSSVPVVHIDLSLGECITGTVNLLGLDDDLRDHWLSRGHKQERLRLIHRLFDFADRGNTRVTLLSGDIHVGALGLLEKKPNETERGAGGSIYQLTSSPIVHNPAPWVMGWYYDHRAHQTETVDRGITSAFVKFPAADEYYICGRNWLALEIERKDRNRIWCNWHVEGESTPYVQTIDPRA